VTQRAAREPRYGRGQGETGETRDGGDEEKAGQGNILGTGVDGVEFVGLTRERAGY